MTVPPPSLQSALRDRYLLQRELGRGGMATVYLARDLRHDRKVALKVLRPELAAVIGADRFLTEIRTTANLQHPHILPLHDSGEADGLLYYVMPYVAGESLRECLRREKQLPVADAVRITTEVASALDYAHRHGVIHRDIKPENILLHDGQALVADFGIALAASRAGGARITQTGISLGTPQYMSPEQAAGERELDGRTDIYSLGCVLYEMLTGEPPFTGPTAQAILARVLTSDPVPPRAIRKTIAAELEDAVLTALAKLPADRWASAAELASVLDGWAPRGPPSRAPPRVERASRAHRRQVALAVILGSVLLAGLGFVAGMRWRATAPALPMDWEGDLLGGSVVAMHPRISPDGQSIAFAAMVNGQSQVGVLKPASGDWAILTHDRGHGLVDAPLAWSRDGTRIYYSRLFEVPRGIFSISPLGGDERLVLENAGGPAVLPDGSLLVGRINRQRQWQVHRFWPETGHLQALNALARFFCPFPDGREAVFYGRPASDTAAHDHLYSLDLESGRVRRLAPRLTITPALWLFPLAVTPDGRWVLFDLSAGNLHRIVAVPRDGSSVVRPLVTLTRGPLAIDMGLDWSLYADQTTEPAEILRYTARDRRLERRRIPDASYGPVLPLPDGRALVAVRSVGRTRLMVIAPDKDPVPFVDTEEETTWPMAVLGRERVLLVLGSAPHRVVAIASLATGRIVARLTSIQTGRARVGLGGGGDALEALAGSPDGKTVFYSSSGVVWAMSSEGGEPRRIGSGDGVAVDPQGRFLVVNLLEEDRVRLVRVPLQGGAEVEIPIRGNLRLAPEPLAPSAIGRDGRLVVRVVSPGSWFWPAAIFDPQTGRTQPIAPGFDEDMPSPAWSADGGVVTRATKIESSLWRFRPMSTAIKNP